MDERGSEEDAMNVRIETIAGIPGARIARRPEAVDLHPAAGIVAAIGLSLLAWSSMLLLVVWF